MRVAYVSAVTGGGKGGTGGGGVSRSFMSAHTRGGRGRMAAAYVRKESCDNAEEEANGRMRVRAIGGVFFTPA